MKDLNKFQIDKLCTVLFSYLTRYRMVPALYLLARERQADEKHTPEWQRSMEKALSGLKAELSRILDYHQLSDDDILELVYEHRSLIQYTFHDMYYFYQYIRFAMTEPERLVFEEKRMKYYLPAMAEIVNSPFIDWRHGIFDCGVKNPTVLDIGCGHSPYPKLFRRDNIGDIWYYGIDKRKQPTMAHPTSVAEGPVLAKWIEAEIQVWLSSKENHIKEIQAGIDTVFFGNSLHCMQEPVKLLEKCAKLPKVTKIMAVEFAPKSALNFMFDFHMYMHAGTGEITEYPIPNGWFLEISYPTTQHIMHTYTKKA